MIIELILYIFNTNWLFTVCENTNYCTNSEPEININKQF